MFYWYWYFTLKHLTINSATFQVLLYSRVLLLLCLKKCLFLSGLLCCHGKSRFNTWMSDKVTQVSSLRWIRNPSFSLTITKYSLFMVSQHIITKLYINEFKISMPSFLSNCCKFFAIFWYWWIIRKWVPLALLWMVYIEQVFCYAPYKLLWQTF